MLSSFMQNARGWVPTVPPALPFLHSQVRFKRSKKRKMVHRVLNDVKRETMGLPPGPSLGSVVGNPESPYEIARQVKQHLERLAAMDPTHIRRKKDYGRYNFHRVLRATGMTHESAPYRTKGGDSFVTSLTDLQDKAKLPVSALHERFPFPHTLDYRSYWGPPSVETEPNRYEGSMTGVSVSFRVSDLLLKEQEAQRLIDIVGSQRYDSETGVVTITADSFPDRNHNAAFLGDVLQRLVALSIDSDS